jgi:glycosyltransferase involved in cell wall biosynthesis
MTSSARPKLLYLTRRWPARTGGGTAMRSGILVEALAHSYEVYVLVVNSGGIARCGTTDCLTWCKRAEYCAVDQLQNPAYRGLTWRGDPNRLLAAEFASPLAFLESLATPDAVHVAARVYDGLSFDTVHISRLCMAGFAEPYLRLPEEIRPRMVLDLDDIESKTHLRLADLHRAAGNSIHAQIHSIEAEKHFWLEREWIPRFDEVWVCSQADRVEIQTSHAHPCVATVPNAVRIPGRPAMKASSGPPVLFFIGHLEYFPNEDALLHFQSEILPLIRKCFGRPFRFVVAGAGVSRVPARLSTEPEVVVMGEVPQVAPYYEDADVVIAPIRAGGGTRIKILEAFSFRKPVVATPLAAEGLQVSHAVELLLANSPAEFAQACTDLFQSCELRESLGQRAFEFVTSRHSLERLTAMLSRRHALDCQERNARHSDASIF